jgi:xanthine dehydrogenase accessory factor
MKAATLARIARAQQQREALLVVTRLADGAQCVVDAAGCSGDLALAPEQAAEAAALLAAGRSAGLAAAAGLFARAYVPAPRLLIVGAVHIAHRWRRRRPRCHRSPERFPACSSATMRWPASAATAGRPSHDPKLDDPALECPAHCSTSARWAAGAPTKSAWIWATAAHPFADRFARALPRRAAQ